MNKTMRGKLNKAGKALRDGGAQADDCADFGKWWYVNDWRGQKKQKPQPAQVVECWGAFTEWREDGNGQKDRSTPIRAKTAESIQAREVARVLGPNA